MNIKIKYILLIVMGIFICLTQLNKESEQEMPNPYLFADRDKVFVELNNSNKDEYEYWFWTWQMCYSGQLKDIHVHVGEWDEEVDPSDYHFYVEPAPDNIGIREYITCHTPVDIKKYSPNGDILTIYVRGLKREESYEQWLAREDRQLILLRWLKDRLSFLVKKE